jgi:hypothetical protein
VRCIFKVESEPAREDFKARVHNFFENPRGRFAFGVQTAILLLIFVAVALAVVEEFFRDTAAQYSSVIGALNHVVLFAFTVEYVLRVASAPRRLDYARKPLNLIDLFAILPNFLEILFHLSVDYSTMGLRGIRIVRFLRFARFIRGLRLFRFAKRFGGVFQYEDTVLQAITPMILLGLSVKGSIWFLESQDLWISNPNLGDLFAIIGFALGIILSQKIAASYDKFVRVEEASVRIYGTLQTLRLIINGFNPGAGTKVCSEWVSGFLGILKDPGADNFKLLPYNDGLYREIAECEKCMHDQFWTLHAQLCSDASFCLNKKVRLTPRAYDTLLHQVTVVYFILIAAFIPGFMGVVSLVVAIYTLYGMYHLTQDLDSIVGGDYNLINIDLSELEHFVSECKGDCR